MVTLEEEWNKKFIIKIPGDIRVIGPDEHKIDEPKNTKELIDILHHISHYKKNNKHDKINQFLLEVKYNNTKQLRTVHRQSTNHI